MGQLKDLTGRKIESVDGPCGFANVSVEIRL